MKRKKIILTLACAAMALSFTACGNSAKDTTAISSNASASEADTKNENTQIANPWADCDTLKDAEKITGFSFEIPEAIDGYSVVAVRALEDQMIEVIYQRADNSEESVILRKGRGTEDVSGDYNEYRESKQTTVREYQVTEKGNDGNVMLATWTDEGYAYSVGTSGMNEDAIEGLIQQIK